LSFCLFEKISSYLLNLRLVLFKIYTGIILMIGEVLLQRMPSRRLDVAPTIVSSSIDGGIQPSRNGPSHFGCSLRQIILLHFLATFSNLVFLF
jgi:hypothetical protein